MEARKILIANTKTQKRYSLTTDVQTLGQLKSLMRNNDISFDDDMDFTEGYSKTKLLNDDSQLPTNVTRIDRETGEATTTNDLVIIVTNTRKKISSGAMSRVDAYAIIKRHNMQEGIKEEFGKNFTQVKTSDLEDYINGYIDADTTAGSDYDVDAYVSNDNNVPVDYSKITALNDLKRFINANITWALEDLDSLSCRLKTIANCLKRDESGIAQEEKEDNKKALKDSDVTEDELDDLIAGVQ